MTAPRSPGWEQSVEPTLTPDAIPLLRYTSLVRRYAGLIVITVLVGLGGAGFKLMLSPRSYTSTVDVLAPPVAVHAGIPRSSLVDQEEIKPPKEFTIDTEVQLVYSEGVLGRLAKVPGFQASRRELKERIRISVPTHTRVLSIAVRAGDPGHARRGAAAVGAAYVDVRQKIMGAVQERNHDVMQRRIALFREKLKMLPGDADEFTRITARTRRQKILKEITETQKRMSALDSRAVQPGEVVRDPQQPVRADSLREDVALASGAGVGLLVWVLIARIRERRPRKIRSPADIRLDTLVPILVESPIVGGGHRHLCRRLRNEIFEKDAGTILVVGIPEGAPEISQELAELCAEAGADTTLLAADGMGVADRSADDELPLRIRTIRTDDGDRELSRSIAEANRKSDIVIITTAGLESADTVSAAAACELVFVTAQRGRVFDRDLAHGVAALDHAALPASGIVLTGNAPVSSLS